MEYGFKIRAEFAHVKLITKALDILKSISKGEFIRCVSLLEENKNLKLLLGEQIAMSGKLDYKIDILNDEIIALKNHIALLMEGGVYHNL